MGKDTIYISEEQEDSLIVQSVIFDMGGVIFPFDHMISCRKLSGYCRYEPKAIYDQIVDSELKDLFNRGQITPEEFYRKATNMLKLEDISFDKFLEIWSNIFQRSKEVWQLISALKHKGVSLYLLSNTDKVHFEHLENKYQLSQLFDAFILSFKTGKVKPEPKIFREAIEKINLPPKDLIFIDDTKENVVSACNLNLNSIHFKTPGKLKKDLANFEIG
ncbi:MAG: HAD family hydrolase [Candidatus Bipolaricaulia bacterium]